MYKYKTIVEKIIRKIKGRKFTTVAVGTVILLALAAVIVLALVNYAGKSNQETDKPDYKQLSYDFTKDSCQKDLSKISSYDTSKQSEDSAKILNYQAECYLKLNQFDEAQKAYEQMIPICRDLEGQSAKRCLSYAQEGVQAAKAKDNGEDPQQSTSSSPDSDPKVQQQVNDLEQEQ